MNRAALRRLARRLGLLHAGKRRRPSRRQAKRQALGDDMAWLGELHPITPPPERAEPAEAWAPRITRWIRVTFPIADDTMLLPAGTAAMVLELLATDFAWDVP